MKHLKHLILLFCMAGCLAACKRDEPFDVEAQFAADTTAIRSFITTNDIPAVKHESGVFYQIIEEGAGDVNYTASTEITADYKGSILNGAIFDNSNGAPVSFTLGRVITGWQIGIPLIQKGGKIRLFIPSYYGYGNRGQSSIPPNAILDFSITLTDVQ